MILTILKKFYRVFSIIAYMSSDFSRFIHIYDICKWRPYDSSLVTSIKKPS